MPLGRKGLEPSTANAIEFTAQPVIPTNGTFLIGVLFVYLSYINNIIYWVLLILINSVQLPLHEPYFDLTLIKVTHTKIFLIDN